MSNTRAPPHHLEMDEKHIKTRQVRLTAKKGYVVENSHKTTPASQPRGFPGPDTRCIPRSPARRMRPRSANESISQVAHLARSKHLLDSKSAASPHRGASHRSSLHGPRPESHRQQRKAQRRHTQHHGRLAVLLASIAMLRDAMKSRPPHVIKSNYVDTCYTQPKMAASGVE